MNSAHLKTNETRSLRARSRRLCTEYWRGEASIHWKELVVSSMRDYYAPVPTLNREERKTHEQDQILELIEEMSESDGSKAAVVEDWMRTNEKK